jgi:hypothetical protein
MTTPNNSGSAADDWVHGRLRFDQIAYDLFRVRDRLAGRDWISAFVGHIYNRDRTPNQARAEITRWLIVDIALLGYFERRVPNFTQTVFLRGRIWPLYTIYMYGKNTASFNTLFLTGIDSGVRGYVTAQARAYEAMNRGEFLPPD